MSAGDPRHGWAVLRAAAPAIVLAVLMLAPFLGKAFTIDDTLFLLQAQHVLVDPLHPTAFDGVFTIVPERMSRVMASGPAMAYLLVPTVARGGSEWIAHLTQLALLVVALLSVASLALRLRCGERASRAASLLLAAAPAVLGMAATAMPDIPAMAFGVLGVERAVAWAQDKRPHQAVLASLALAVATLFRSHVVLLIGIAAVACVGDCLDRDAWRRLRWSTWAPLAVSPLVVVAVLGITSDPQSSATAVAGAANRYVHASAMPGNLVAFLVHWVLVLPLAVPWLLLRPRRIAARPYVYLAAVAAWLFLRTTPEGHPLLVACVAGLGAAVIVDLLDDARRRRDGVQLMLGLWIIVPLSVVPYLHLPSKYLLAAAPAAAIAVARSITEVSWLRARVVLGTALALGLALGALILRADARFADLGRRAAAELIPTSGASAATVWFDGHWGFQWYAQRAGASPLTTGPPHPRSGDLMVTSALTGLGFLDNFPARRFLGSVTDARPGGRVMCRSAGAGFYTNDFGYWPWAWSAEPVDRYELWSIDRAD